MKYKCKSINETELEGLVLNLKENGANVSYTRLATDRKKKTSPQNKNTGKHPKVTSWKVPGSKKVATLENQNEAKMGLPNATAGQKSRRHCVSVGS